VPPQELCRIEIKAVAHDGQMFDGDVPIELKLLAHKLHRDVAQWFRRSSASRRT